MSRVSSFNTAYVRYLQKWRWLVIVIFVAAAAVSGVFMSKFLNATSANFDAPKNSASVIAMNMKAKYFAPVHRPAHHSERVPVLVELSKETLGGTRSSSGKCPFFANNFSLTSPLLSGALDKFSTTLEKNLLAKLGANANSSSSSNPAAAALQVVNYVQESAVAPIYARQLFISRFDQQRTLLVPVTYTIYDAAAGAISGNEFASFLADTALPAATAASFSAEALRRSMLSSNTTGTAETFSSSFCREADFAALQGALSAAATGFSLLSREMVSAGKSGMAETDAIVIPIALLILGVTVKSVRMALLPLLTIGLALLLSFGVMAGVAQEMQISTAAPSLCMSLAISTSVDFSLFIAARYIEAVSQSGSRGAAAVVQTLLSAGHTILLSGITFSVSIVPLAFFPVDIISSFGVAAVVTIIASMLNSLVFVPAVILAAPSFFEEAAKPLAHTWVWKNVVAPWILCGKCCNGTGRCEDGAATTATSATGGGVTSLFTSSKSRRQAADSHASVHSPWRGGPGSLGGGDSDAGAAVGSAGGGAPEEGTETAGSGSVRDSIAGGSANFTSLSMQGVNPSSGGNLSSGALYFDAPLLAGGASGNKNKGATATTAATRTPDNRNQHSVQSDTRSSFYQTSAGGGAVLNEVLLNSSWFGKLAPVFQSTCGCVVVILLCLALSAVLGWQAVAHFNVDSDLRTYLPRGSAQMHIFERFQDAFGWGEIDPIDILFVNRAADNSHSSKSNSSSNSILSAVSIRSAQRMLHHISRRTNPPTPVSAFRAVFFFNGKNISFEQIRNCSNSSNSSSSNYYHYCDPNIEMELRASVNRDQTAMLARIVDPPVNPVGPNGQEYYSSLKSAAHDEGSSGEHLVYVAGGPFRTLDAVTAIYKKAPAIAIAACAAVTAVLGVAFRSVIFPLRSLVSIAMTTSVVFGCGVLVYQKGALDWIGWGSLQQGAVGGAPEAALSWLPPLVAFCISIGVCLDMDLFLLIKIHEFVVCDGVPTRDAAILGLCSSGGTITAAGLILAIAFFGLVLQEISVLNQIGFLLCTGTIFDTLVVRGLFTPAALSLVGRFHWWPSRPEEAAYAQSESLQPDVFHQQHHHDDESDDDGVNGPVLSATLGAGTGGGGTGGGGTGGLLARISPRAAAGGRTSANLGSPIRGVGARSPRQQQQQQTDFLPARSPRGAGSALAADGGAGGVAPKSPRDSVNLSRARLDALQTAQM